MSHSVNIKTQFKNVASLLEQFKAQGWRIVTDSKCRTYYSDPRKDEVHKYVAQNPIATGYDIGVNVDNEGNATFVCDFYDTSIEQQLGQNLKKIKQGYAVAELKSFLQEEDMEYQINELPTGELVVIAEK